MTTFLRRLPMPLMLMVAPLIGLAFVIFLPFIGFGAVLVLAASKAREAAGALADQFGWARRPQTVALTTAAPAETVKQAHAEVQDAADRPER